jgi:2-dehydropantoate 2-reductase
VTGRFIVYGAGALGGVIGAELFDSGQDVVLIARGAHRDAIQTDGLTYITPDRSANLAIPVVDHPGELTITDDDVVILGTKSQDTAAALEALADVAPAGVAVVCAQNGVENERLAARHFANVYGLCALSPNTHLSPGVVIASSTPVRGVLHLGRYPEGDDATADRIAADLSAANFAAYAVPDVQRYKYTKLLSNLNNAAQATLQPDAVPGVSKRAQDEGLAVYSAAGIDHLPMAELNAYFGQLNRQEIEVAGYSNIGGSTWQSLARRTGRTEVDFLNGEIVLLGRLHHVPTPVNATLQSMARAAANARRAPATVSEAEFEAELAKTLSDTPVP